MYNVKITQRNYDPYVKDGKKVDYWREETLTATCADFEALTTLIGVVTSACKDTTITITEEA